MKVDQLNPPPTSRETFKRSRVKFVPDKPGCYALTTFGRDILYVGLASNLRARMVNHLDNPAKTTETELGRAVLFYWLGTADLQTLERTWMNAHVLEEGALPLLNKAYSPLSL